VEKVEEKSNELIVKLVNEFLKLSILANLSSEHGRHGLRAMGPDSFK